MLVTTGYRYALVYEGTGDLTLLLDLNDKPLLTDLHSYSAVTTACGTPILAPLTRPILSSRDTEHRLLYARRTGRAE